MILDVRFLQRYKCKGFSLPTALTLLLILAMLGTGFVSQTLYNEQIAGNQHDYVIASQEATAGLRAGESFLRNCLGRPQASDAIRIDSTPTVCTATDFIWDDRLSDYQKQETILPWFQQPWAWWSTNALARTTTALNHSTIQTPYVIEEVNFVYDAASKGSNYRTQPGVGYYRVTARGRAQSENSGVTLQSGFSRHFN
jgi:Tfp pilus assembly protein PilX